jgi:tRNA threonylcarbamoyladenosine biosynthesis protein TsaB
MKLLAFDTSTEVLSIAVQNSTSHDGVALEAVLEWTGPGGALASTRLIPEIQNLMAQAGLRLTELDAIAFGAGPGAFTGLRSSCAVAQGLGFAAGIRLCPINTLHALALQRFRVQPQLLITAALDARMGEIYWQRFDFSSDPMGLPMGEPQLAKADQPPKGLEFELGDAPTARTLLELAADQLGKGLSVLPAEAWPLYVRNKVAQTTLERSLNKADHAA